MKHYKLVHTFGNIIHEGTKTECELILKAFETYGEGMHKFDLVPVVEKYRLSDDTREEVQEFLVERLPDVMFGDGVEADMVADGMEYIGVYNMTDKQLMEVMSFICNEDESDELYAKAKAEMAIEQMLGDDDEG